MKKIILLLSVFALVFTSCESDDDATPQPQNLTSIVGTWKPFQTFKNGVEQALDACEIQDTLIFAANNDFSVTNYDDFDTTGTCQLDSQESGTWSNTGNVYTITVDGEADSITITFGVNTFSYEEIDTFDGVTTTYREVYKKQ